MNVRELTRDQLDELKLHHVHGAMINPSWGDLAEAVSIPDGVIFDHYAGIHFVNDDFFCTAGRES